MTADELDLAPPRPATGDGELCGKSSTSFEDYLESFDEVEQAEIRSYVSAAVQEARIGWVDHATMVSQINAALVAEREDIASTLCDERDDLEWERNNERKWIASCIRARSKLAPETEGTS